MPRYQQPFETKDKTKDKAKPRTNLETKGSAKAQSRDWRDWPKPARIALVAGEGALPAEAAKSAVAMGIEVIPFTIGKQNAAMLQQLCGTAPVPIVPGLIRKNLSLFQSADVSHLVFAGKVNKWTLLRDPRLDDVALEGFGKLLRKGDDDIMLWLLGKLAEIGIEVLPQTLFLSSHFQPEGCLTTRQASGQTLGDIAYGLAIAKEMGRLDVGQSVVVKDGMLIAVEAIEGTDACLRRAGQLIHGGFFGRLFGRAPRKRKGGVVVKVAKPGQDQRFDVPTVGLRTLATMKRAGLDVLAVEAGETLFLDKDAMARFADRHGMIIVSVVPSAR